VRRPKKGGFDVVPGFGDGQASSVFRKATMVVSPGAVISVVAVPKVRSLGIGTPEVA